ncbi:cytospin-A isoform X2 [Parasteatoda tepidariorum]|uniref:cytospin-A isoform X2 n=1 Tax=Parasteatoda tepidariorum TaxID=114398 RepID=UPI00077FCF35|nr:cytospin-A [Parasteatoda tepidariorum]XP_015929935.1 cytospin-A [Parasteatoda tepidariorum]
MLKVIDCLRNSEGNMKNNKPVSGKPSGNTISSKNQVQSILGPPRTNKVPSSEKILSSTSVKKSSTVKSRSNTCSSSQESLSGIGTSVRRKTSVQPKVSSSSANKNDCTPIRSINNLQTVVPLSSTKKATFRRLNQSNMRRAVSKDSVDFAAKEREKENVKIGLNRNKSNNCITILQMEKEKVKMEQQISELVKNAESKKAEIATLKMEINKLKDLKSDDAVDQLRQELESVQLENQALKERLLQLGVPLEMTALSDTQKEQILIQRSLSGSFLNFEKNQNNLSDGPKSLDTEVGEASGVNLPPSGRSLSEWERGSSSSLSEMSVACLQDRIMQMEETHHSTNEELQATLQELTDLQDQLVDLQLENERMADEKAVLLESLCSQTEKLEECRTQITQLKQLLFQQHNQEGLPLSPSERECNLVDLLKKAQEAHDVLLMKQEELSSALQAAKNDCGPQTDLLLLRDRVRLLESTIESINADKRLLESQLNECQEQLSANQIEVSQLKLQLENEQQKVSELEKEREAGATSELNALLQETRKDKEKVEERAVRLQEQLALSQREVTRYKDQLQQLQEENMVAKNNAHKEITDMEYRLQQITAEKELLSKEMETLQDALQQTKLTSQHHLEDKRHLKSTVGELQKAVNETASQLTQTQKELEELKKKHKEEIEEWNRFQTDLLTTVRVANDFSNEAQQDVERLTNENKQLSEKNASLEAEIKSLRIKSEPQSPTFSKTNLKFNADVNVISNVEKDLNNTTRRQLSSTKRADRGANQLSVRSLIESIENATKHAKGQGPSSSCSSSSSSLNSIASETRLNTNTILMNNSNDVYITPSIRSSADSLPKDVKTASQSTRPSKKTTNENLNHIAINNGTLSGEQHSLSNRGDGDSLKPLPAHPVSILSSKLDPIRRNSYGDIVEKKDPLSSLVKGGGSKRNALLKWCQNKTLGYKGIDITNFSSSWNDGLAFCAIMHSYLPNMVPYDELDSRDKRRNFTLAFQAAESVGITTTLNINDLISQERPDWQSIMTYVTQIYKHFET